MNCCGPPPRDCPGAGRTAMTLSSQTTNERGLIAAVDLAPTILRHLGLTPIPADMRGEPLRTDGPLHSASLRALMAPPACDRPPATAGAWLAA